LSPQDGGGCSCDVVFVVDSSAKKYAQNWFDLKQFVMDVTSGFNIASNQTHVGVVSYSTRAVKQFHLQQYYDADVVTKAIWDMAYLAGLTNTADGISVSVGCHSLKRGTDTI